MASSKLLVTLLMAFITASTVVSADAKLRRAVTPCLSCTTLNRDQCCQKHNKCCGTGTGTSNVPQPQGNTNVRQPGGTYRSIDNRQPYNRQTAASVRGSCPARSNMARLRQSCANTCANDNDCRLENTRCCPPPTLCCRPLDDGGQCPSTVISTRCCRSCLSGATCRRGEGCCAQPGHSGCCVTGSCVGTRCGNQGGVNIAPSRTNPTSTQGTKVQSSRDKDTVDVPAEIPATELPPSSSRSGSSNSRSNNNNGHPEDVVEVVVIEDEDGNEQTITQTIHVEENGVTVTIFVNGDGTAETITQTVHETETKFIDQTVPHTEVIVEVVISVIDGETYTFTKGEDGKETATYTVMENGEDIVYVTVHTPEVSTVYHDVTVDKTEDPVVMTEHYTETVYLEGLKMGKEVGKTIVTGDDGNKQSVVTKEVTSNNATHTMVETIRLSSKNYPSSEENEQKTKMNSVLEDMQSTKIEATVGNSEQNTKLQPSFTSIAVHASIVKSTSTA